MAILPQPLTAREQEILTLVAQGRSNAEIEAALVIAPATRRAHLLNIYRKYGIADARNDAARVQLALSYLHEAAQR